MTDHIIRQKVADCRMFSGLSETALDILADEAEEQTLEAGRVLFHEGDRATQFYLLLDGHLSLEIPAIEGPVLELQDIGPGEVTGWSWLIAPNLWHFQARARTDIRFLAFDGEAILARCEADPKFGYELVRRFSALMSERLAFSRQKMMAEWKPAGFA